MKTALILATALIAGACTKDTTRPPPPPVTGITFEPPLPRPAFTLTATDGKPYAFHERTAGKLTFLFFGYTFCPDVCPVHAANIAAVLRTMSWEDRQKIDFVFVTTDPDRDSLPALRKWLDHFDSTFVGLRGTIAEVNAAAKLVRIPPAFAEQKAKDGSYGVGHGAAVIAFEPDDTARVIYVGGTRQQDWAADIPKLLTRHAK